MWYLEGSELGYRPGFRGSERALVVLRRAPFRWWFEAATPRSSGTVTAEDLMAQVRALAARQDSRPPTEQSESDEDWRRPARRPRADSTGVDNALVDRI